MIEHLTSWARGHLQDKAHISEEVSEVLFTLRVVLRLLFYSRLNYKKKLFFSLQHKKHQMVIAKVMVEALKHLQKIQECKIRFNYLMPN